MDVTVGPVATANFGVEIDQTTGQPQSYQPVDGAFLTPPPPAGVGMQCSVLDQFSYGQVKATSNDADDHPEGHRRAAAVGQRPPLPGHPHLQSLSVRLSVAVLAALAALLVAAPAAPRRAPCRRASSASCTTTASRRRRTTEQDGAVGRMAASGVETVRTVFDWSEAQPRRARQRVRLRADRRRGAARRAAQPRRAAGRDLLAEVGARVPEPVHVAAEEPVRLRDLPRRARGALRPRRHLLDRPSRAAQAPACASGRSGTSRTCPPTGTRPEKGPYGYARAYPLLLRASYNIVKSLDPGAKIVHGRHHAARLGGDRGALSARHQALLRRGRAPDLPADRAPRREGHRAVPGRDEPARRPEQADLHHRDHLAGVEGEDRADQVPAPGDAARDGHEARPDVPEDGRPAECARAREGVLVHVVVAVRRGGATSTTPASCATTTTSSRPSRRSPATSGARGGSRAAPRPSSASASSGRVRRAAGRARRRSPRRSSAR